MINNELATLEDSIEFYRVADKVYRDAHQHEWVGEYGNRDSEKHVQLLVIERMTKNDLLKTDFGKETEHINSGCPLCLYNFLKYKSMAKVF